jgi:predicted  nucleic acid-binding Zn-ribbon protein
MRISHVLVPMVAAGLMLTGCGSKQPAANAVTQAENAISPLRDDAVRFAPDELKAADATLAQMKAELADGDYKDVIADVPKFNTQIKTLQESVVSRRSVAAAAQNEWDALNAQVPKAVEAIQVRVNALAGSRLPKEVTKENYEAAKTDLAAIKATWAEASAAAVAGHTIEAADKGRTVAAKADEIKNELGMNPAVAAATMAPPASPEIASQ